MIILIVTKIMPFWEKANIAEQSRYMNLNNSDEDIGQIVISKQLAESLVDQLINYCSSLTTV